MIPLKQGAGERAKGRAWNQDRALFLVLQLLNKYQLQGVSMETAAAKTRDGIMVDMNNKTTTPAVLR